MPAKYRSIKDQRIINGELITFDSRKEARRWDYLSGLENVGAVKNLERQKTYELVPKQRTAAGKYVPPVTYRSDFEYDIEGSHIVEDVKGIKTDVYQIKKKLMLYKYGIEIHEV